jgi:uncharacterized membrane protein
MGLALGSSTDELANYRQSGARVQAVSRLRSSLPLITLAAISAAALVLRVLFIDSRGLWSDEAYRVLAARQDTLFDTLRAAWAQPPSAPLYWVALHVWVSLFGHGDVAVRLFSVPASVGTVVVAYLLGKLAGGKLTALLSAALLAISPFAIETGQEATMYAWSALFATGAIWAGISWLKTGRGMVSYIAFSSLLLYTHYMGILLILEILAVGLVWYARGHSTGEIAIKPGDWIKSHVIVAFIYLPWAVAMGIRLLQRAEELSHLEHRAGLADLYGAFVTMSAAPSGAAIWPPVQVTVAVLTGGCLMLLAVLLPRPRAQRHVVWALAAISTGFAVIVVGTSALTGQWLVQPRFFTLVLPAAVVVVASGVDSTWLRSRAPSGAYLTLLGLLLLASWALFQVEGVRAFYTNPVHGRDGVREAAAWLNAERRPGDLVVANNGLLAWSLVQYHDGTIQGLPDDIDVRNGYQLWPSPEQMDFAPGDWQAFTRLAPGHTRVWLVYLPPMDPNGLFMRSMQQRYHLVESRHYGFADVYLFAE